MSAPISAAERSKKAILYSGRTSALNPIMARKQAAKKRVVTATFVPSSFSLSPTLRILRFLDRPVGLHHGKNLMQRTSIHAIIRPMAMILVRGSQPSHSSPSPRGFDEFPKKRHHFSSR
jgi:hypothetical protein